MTHCFLEWERKKYTSWLRSHALIKKSCSLCSFPCHVSDITGRSVYNSGAGMRSRELVSAPACVLYSLLFSPLSWLFLVSLNMLFSFQHSKLFIWQDINPYQSQPVFHFLGRLVDELLHHGCSLKGSFHWRLVLSLLRMLCLGKQRENSAWINLLRNHINQNMHSLLR